jgi:hypothetical protein
MKLASEKSFNRGICPVMNIKGKPLALPFKLEYKTFHFACAQGILGPKQMMVMDIIGTTLIHYLYGNTSYQDRIPTPKEKRVKEISSHYMSSGLIEFIKENLSLNCEGKIREAWYSDEGLLSHIDTKKKRIKKPILVKINDGKLRRQLPFLRKYSSVQFEEMIRQTADCVLYMSYPIHYYSGKKYYTPDFGNYKFPSSLFTLVDVKNTKVSKDNHILEREYTILFDTVLGYMFMQNISSCYMDLLPGKFYEMSDYAQLFYRLLVLTYYSNPKSGKNPKIPISINEVRRRLALKTPDTYMVRQVIMRILKELAKYKFISEWKEEKQKYSPYMYSYKKNTWKDITGEEDSGTDLVDIGN